MLVFSRQEKVNFTWIDQFISSSFPGIHFTLIENENVARYSFKVLSIYLFFRVHFLRVITLSCASVRDHVFHAVTFNMLAIKKNICACFVYEWLRVGKIEMKWQKQTEWGQIFMCETRWWDIFSFRFERCAFAQKWKRWWLWSGNLKKCDRKAF